MRPDEIEARLRDRLNALDSPRRAAPRPHAPDFDRADAIGSYWGNPKTRTFADSPIDCEEDRVFRAVLVGMLGEGDR